MAKPRCNRCRKALTGTLHHTALSGRSYYRHKCPHFPGILQHVYTDRRTYSRFYVIYDEFQDVLDACKRKEVRANAVARRSTSGS